ncbi:hypothetical protein Vretimale_7617 [Volvox reticuliferus]|uniref:Uncharacterized protein n=1 Tax=Volvox reticuliferus TaxID=1737510 RepID=A0A8J4G9A1_9CHLO|nr:hypothetical protein Vretifemale_7687 [Volvox reticuliferus]GIM02784.1 hypothetical protein Vretimale_7617 [Volvox reticuliferus]
MIDSKAVRSPAGQKLIHDLMLGDGDLEVGIAYDDVADAEEAITPASKQRNPRRGALPLRPSNGAQRRGPLLVARSAIGSPKTPRTTGEDREPAAGAPSDRPATAPASSYTLLAPPQLPAARGLKDSRNSTVSPLLERHLVSRHTSAYLGVVTAVLHQVSSPAATGAPRDTQRRPGTVPRDVYHHSALAPPKRHDVSHAATSASAPVSLDGVYGYGGDGAAAASRIAAPGSPTGPHRLFTNGGFHFHESSDMVGSSSFYAPFGDVGGLSTRGGTGEYYVPYLDRSYGSHAPLACTVDAVARRAEAHKALTRQRLLQKQLAQQMASGRKPGPNQQNALQQEQNYQNQHSQLQALQQQQNKGQIVLLQSGPNEPYQLRMEGGVLPVALGLAWDTSPGVVVAAAASAATTAAAIAARAEGLSAAASPYLRDPAASPSLRDFAFSPGNRISPASRGSVVAAIAPSPISPQRRRGRGGGTLEWAQPHAGLAGSGRASPTGAPGSPPKIKLPRTPQTAAEAAVLAAEAEEVVRAHLPPAVRRGYNGHLAAQTVKDWETIAEPNRRMMQEIENATSLVRGNPSRGASAAASAAGGGGGIDGRGRQLRNTGPAGPGSASTKRRVGGQEVARADAATAGVEAAATRSNTTTTDPAGDGTPFGTHTSARARRRYIRYSLDVFPELGLPQRSNSGHHAAAAKSNGPFSTAGVAAAAAAATAAAATAPSALAAAASGWGPWTMSATDSSGLFGLDAETSAEQMDPYNQTEGDYGTPYGAAKGPRYVLAAAARVPVPIHLHPLPTPSAAIAAVVASGGAAAAAAAALPQWVDPLTAAASCTVRGGAASSELDSSQSGLQSSVSTGSALVLPTVGSGSQNSLHSSRGVSRTTSVMLGGLSARGVGLQGCPSVPPLASPSTSMVLDEPSGSLSAGGGGGGSDMALMSRNASVTRRHGVHHSGKQLQASVGGASAGVADDATVHREQSGGGAVGGAVSTSAQHIDGSHQAHAVSNSLLLSTLGTSVPAQEASLLPLMHGAAPASLRPESSLGPSEPLEGSTPTASTAASAAHSPILKPTGSIRGLDLDMDMDLGPAASRASAIQRRGLLPGSSAAGSRLSTPGSNVPASTEEREEEEDVAAEAEEEADAHRDGGEENGWSFRESGFTSAGPSGSVIAPRTAGVITAAVGATAGADEVEWDAGPTPRLVTRQDGSRGCIPSSAVSPLPFRRPSSTASDTVGSASVGSFTPRSGGGGGTSSTHILMEPAGERLAVASPLGDATIVAAAAAADRILNTGGNGTVATDLGADADATAAGQGLDELTDGDGAAGYVSSGEDVSPDMTPRRTASVTAAPQGPVLTHGTGYRVVTSVAASLISEDPREAARLAAQRDLEAQLERSSEHTAKLKAASRASKALARAGPQHSALLPANLPPLSLSQTGGSGYSIVQPPASRIGLAPLEEPQGGALSVLDAPVPAPAEMEAMASAARAALSPALPVTTTSRLGGHQQPQTPSTPGAPPQRRLTHNLQSEKEGRQLQQNAAGSLGPGSYMHIQATIERGRTAQMQDLWAT